MQSVRPSGYFADHDSRSNSRLHQRARGTFADQSNLGADTIDAPRDQAAALGMHEAYERPHVQQMRRVVESISLQVANAGEGFADTVLHWVCFDAHAQETLQAWIGAVAHMWGNHRHIEINGRRPQQSRIFGDGHAYFSGNVDAARETRRMQIQYHTLNRAFGPVNAINYRELRALQFALTDAARNLPIGTLDAALTKVNSMAQDARIVGEASDVSTGRVLSLAWKMVQRLETPPERATLLENLVIHFADAERANECSRRDTCEVFQAMRISFPPSGTLRATAAAVEETQAAQDRTLAFEDARDVMLSVSLPIMSGLVQTRAPREQQLFARTFAQRLENRPEIAHADRRRFFDDFIRPDIAWTALEDTVREHES